MKRVLIGLFVALLATFLAFAGVASAAEPPPSPSPSPSPSPALGAGPASSASPVAPAPGAKVSAAAADTRQTFRNRSTGRCIDDSTDFGLRTYGCNFSNYQTFIIHHWADGTFRMQNVATGRCISESSSNVLHPTTCDSSDFESWKSYRNSSQNGVVLDNQRTQDGMRDGSRGLFLNFDVPSEERADESWY